MDGIQKQEYRVRDLPTRCITLFPTRAQVVRDIKDVILKPGVNQVSVLGFTPTVDEHSIKVEGTGAAVITDISVELLENPDIFHEIYDSDPEKPESDDDDDDKWDPSRRPDESDDENPSHAKQDLKDIKKKVQALNDEIKRAAEVVSSAESRLKMLDELREKYEPKSGSDVGDIVQTYQEQRDKIFQDHMQGTLRQRELNDDLPGLQKTETKLQQQVHKEAAAANKAWRKEQQARQKKYRLKLERGEKRKKERRRVRQERQRFWARSCYVVHITLDATQYTPVSSRRSSAASVTDLVKPAVEDQNSSPDAEAANLACDLSITYVTSSAFWSASYDLQLSTTSNTGTLFFDAQLTNNTSESWKDCKVVLSTSQAVFSGLQDAIPKLVPWHIKLADKSATAHVFGDITSSTQEAREQGKWKRINNFGAVQANSGAHLIGFPGPFHAVMPQPQQKTNPFAGMLSSTNAPPSQPPNHGGASLFGSLGQPANAAGTDAPPPPPPNVGGLFGTSTIQAPARRARHAVARAPESSATQNPQNDPSLLASGDSYPSRDRDGPDTYSQVGEADTLHEQAPDLSFQESAMGETGFTTTYDLPGAKSLVPSSTASKQRVAQIHFTNVVFSHTVVAKYRPGAFLSAKLRNASKISLLRGPVGLTLDGTFMGRSTLPRCSSADTFTMSLGVDPAVVVTYPKPDVRRSTSGVFTRENSTAYTRSVTVANTRGGGRAVRLLVLDQVPVSEDEKLRVEVVHPRGLAVGGAGVMTGVQDGSDKDGKVWGTATATLKKGGEVDWDVELNAGKSVKLTLEYDVSLPVGDNAVQADLVSGRLN